MPFPGLEITLFKLNTKLMELSIIQMEKCKKHIEIQRKYILGEGKEKRGDFEIRA